VRTKNAVRQGAIKHLFILLLQRVVGISLFLLAAGTFRDMRGMTNLALYLMVSIIACAMMFSGYQETLNERGKKQENTKNWDKILLPILVLLVFHGMYLVAGLGVRFACSTLPIEWFYVGIVLYLVSSVFTVLPILENKHFEATSRIQSDRGHTVITTGPYRIVRHPGYAGIVLWAIASALMFGTAAVGVVSFAIIVTVCVRTYLEDRMLKRELDGYDAYSQKVRYRLLPFVW
jgi:protein-S-isoprenylcysteine O-methyltransferase Ste14